MIRPDISAITSIAGEHHRSLGTLENIRSEKAEMVRSLPADGFAILNGDDPNVLWMAGQTSAKVITFGFGKENMVRADGFDINWPEGNRISLMAEGTARTVQTRLFGRQMVYPVLAGIAAAMAAGRNLEQAVSGLERMIPTPGRMELFMLDNGAAVLNDCLKGTLETIHSSLQTLSEISSRRRMVILGEVEDAQGPRGPVHREIGAILSRCASKAILISSRKTYGAVRIGAADAGMNREAVVYAGHDWFDALQILKPDLKAGDIVLLKGRRTQRLDRLLLALQGRSVQCRTPRCKSSIKLCDACPMLERGWDGLRVTV
jgi:UDP-N-acetylmuramoyl-tripeptide--D-alanyl-D-alanine ligase